MSDTKCVVPNCSTNATTGILFPKDKCKQEQWLKTLQIPIFQPTPKSFVCINHFTNASFLNDNAENSLNLENEPIPVAKFENGTSSNLEPNDQIDQNFSIDLICRLCRSHNVSRNLDEYEGEHLISFLITKCIPNLKTTDSCNWICGECLETIVKFYKLREQFLKDEKKSSRKRTKSVSDSNYPKPDIDEFELMKVIEGSLPEDMRNADNIIIQVQSDDEVEQAETNVEKVELDAVKLPKDVKVRLISNKEEICNAENFVGIFNSQFCLVNCYLYEYRLCKGFIRHLKCIVPKCKSLAQQSLSSNETFEDTVLVKIPHNHPAPSPDERKKQIFLHLMHRKMQNDKCLNFQNVYEEFCEIDPDIRRIVPITTVINQICLQQVQQRAPRINSFDEFYGLIENVDFQKLHFTHSNSQFYQERFTAGDGSKAIIFANRTTIENVLDGTLMYVDASFTIGTTENFQYHLVTVLVWIIDSYYPIMFALIDKKSQELFKEIFTYLHDKLAPNLRPQEIVTDYEASLYYSLGEVYLDSHIGGSVFYYAQNLYKKICSLKLSRELETNSCFRSIYHMLLMLPLLPVNTILDGLSNIMQQAIGMEQLELASPLFAHVKSQWINRVTPELFCVHRLENRINENVIAPFKKLRDLIMLSKPKMQKQQITIVAIVEKLIELEAFLSVTYAAPSKKSFARDLSSSQKKNVIRAWQFIENHPKINLNNFFTKVLGYIKCMENQLWIWGFYRYTGDADDELIDATNFSIVNTGEEEVGVDEQYISYIYPDEEVVNVVINRKDGFLIKDGRTESKMEIEFDNNVQESY